MVQDANGLISMTSLSVRTIRTLLKGDYVFSVSIVCTRTLSCEQLKTFSLSPSCSSHSNRPKNGRVMGNDE